MDCFLPMMYVDKIVFGTNVITYLNDQPILNRNVNYHNAPIEITTKDEGSDYNANDVSNRNSHNNIEIKDPGGEINNVSLALSLCHMALDGIRENIQKAALTPSEVSTPQYDIALEYRNVTIALLRKCIYDLEAWNRLYFDT